MARTKVKMECLECGKKFSVSPMNSDPRCPKCHGVDVEVADEATGYRVASSGPSKAVNQADGFAGEPTGGEWFRFLHPGVSDEYDHDREEE